VAAWPAASLVGSYELLLWLVRTAADRPVVRKPSADQAGLPANQAEDALRLLPSSSDRDTAMAAAARTWGGPGAVAEREWSGPAYDQPGAAWASPRSPRVAAQLNAQGVDAAAVAAYRLSLDICQPLSERKLAAMFGKTSRRWARHRMAEAREAAGSAQADSQPADQRSTLAGTRSPSRPGGTVRAAASAG
jgi:hypothetical protein